MVKESDSNLSPVVSEVEECYKSVDSLYNDCFHEIFKLDAENSKKIKELRDCYETLFSLIRKISNILIDENEVIVNEMNIRDGDVYEYASNNTVNDFKFFETPEIKRIVSEKCDNEEKAVKFSEAYDYSAYIHSIVRQGYISVVRVRGIPYSKRYGEIDEDKNYYLIYRPNEVMEDVIYFEPHWKDSMSDAMKNIGLNTQALTKSKKEREEIIKQIWHSDALGLAVKDLNKKLYTSLHIASDAEDKVLDDFSDILVANDI